MIRLVDVHKKYEKGPEVLHGLNLLVRDGEFVFLTGPSGSGKSTVLKLITGELKSTSGRVLVNGYDMELLASWQIAYVRRTLGVVFQDYRLISDRTVRENLNLAVLAAGHSQVGMAERVEYAAMLTGLSDKLNEQICSLSGGEKQRAGIARAVINHPQAILADEPTGNLDPAQSDSIMDLLARVNALGMTVLVVTHDKNFVSRYKFRSVAIHDGRIVHDGTGYYMSE